ncbi:unnamed protein product [Closterium sp. Yama58-4]|nr:unnamed protein product [Closterium sp. Yama58-4]
MSTSQSPNLNHSLHCAASSFADLVLGSSSSRTVAAAGPDGQSASHAASRAGIPGQSAAREAASPEADLSAQLSVADLLTCLSRIEERSEQVKAEIIQEVEGRHEELRQLMWHACQAGDDVAVLLAEVDALAASVSPAEGLRGREGGGNHDSGSGPASATGSGIGPGSGAALGFVEEVVRATNEVRALNQAANEKAEIRKAVEEIVQLQRKQAEMQILLGSGRLLEAATLARALKASFVEGDKGDVGGPREGKNGEGEGGKVDEGEGKSGEEERGEEPVVVTLLRQQVDASCKQLQHSLEQQLWQMLVIDPSSHSIRIVTSAALTPAITSAASTAASAPVVQLPEVLSALEMLTGGEGSTIRLQRLAAALWPRMADSIIERCLALAVPQETRELARFQEVVEVTRAFEAALRAEGFLAPLPKASAVLKDLKARAGGAKRAAAPVGDRLMAYAADVDVHFAEKKRVAALAAVRHLLLKGDFSVSRLVVTPVSPDVSNAALQPAVFGQQLLQLVVGGAGAAAAAAAAAVTSDLDNSVFFWEPCHVSEPVCKILEIVHNTMEEASQSTDRTAMELYRAARDIFTLYRALPSSAPVDVAQLAMVAVNDRLLLSHVCLSLALQYRARLPAGVRHVATFADVAPFLRQLAEEQMQRVLERHHGYLMEALDGAQGFRNTDEEEVYRCALRALKQVVHHLAHLSSVWRPVSPPSRYLRAMSRLVSAVLSRCCAHVLALPDISVDETEQLRKLFAGMLTRLPPLFHVDLSGAIGSAHGATSASASVAAAADLDADVSDAIADTATLESLVPVYRKLKRLTDLLDMPLVAITQAWESGDLCRCGFTSDEVQRTIRAIFSDTPLRRNCIARPWTPDGFLDDPEVAARRPEMDATCDLWEGKWVYEPEMYPLWKTGSCPWVETGFECEALGRHDTDYMKFRWQPHGCNLPRFNASDIRRRLKGRRLVFVGDSLCRNQFESALCLLSIDLYNVSAVAERTGNNLTKKVDTMVYDFTQFNFTIEYHLSHFLVGFHRAPPDAPPHIGAVVNTDTVDPLFARRLFDERPEGLILVLNAGHWFTPSKISRQNVSFLVNNQTRPDIDETEGFRLAMVRVSDWLQQWPPKAANATAVFRTYAPAHFA